MLTIHHLNSKDWDKYEVTVKGMSYQEDKYLFWSSIYALQGKDAFINAVRDDQKDRRYKVSHRELEDMKMERCSDSELYKHSRAVPMLSAILKTRLFMLIQEVLRRNDI